MAVAARLRGLGSLAGNADAAVLLQGAPAPAPVVTILTARDGRADTEVPPAARIIAAATGIDDLVTARATFEHAAGVSA